MLSRLAINVPDPRGPPRGPARGLAIALAAAALVMCGWLLDLAGHWGRALLAVGLTLALTVIVMGVLAGLAALLRTRRLRRLEQMIGGDCAPCLATDAEGRILARNGAAEQRLRAAPGADLARTLSGVFASPSAVLYRLQCRAIQDGAAREDLVTRRGHLRVSVHGLGDGRFLWRVEDLPERLQAGGTLETLPVPVLTVGRAGAVLFMNEAARQLTGERRKTIESVFATLPVRPGALNTVTGADGPVDVVVTEQTRTAGRRELYLLPLTETGGRGHESVFELLPVPLLKLDAAGRILLANRQATQLLALPGGGEARLGEVMRGLGRPIADWLSDTTGGQAGQSSEFLRLVRDDKEVFVQVTLTRITENGEYFLIAVLNDATELKSLEAQFVQSQKMQAIGQLAGGVAHDFNNLLTAISGHCDLLLLRHDQGDQDYADLVQINQNANRAAALVGQLLAFSRKQTLRPEVLDLRDILSDLTHLLNRLVGEKVTLTLTHDPVLRPIRADKRQLEQVLMNLVVNARDAMPDGGEIRIETEAVTLAEPLARDRASVPAGDYLLLRVADEGVGISTDKLPKVFEPFYTTKHTSEGTGLGLSTAYGIIKQSGGFIFVDSTPGEGTTFTLYFPIYANEHEDRPAAVMTPPPALPRHGEGVVLLVEDEAPVRAFASRALRLYRAGGRIRRRRAGNAGGSGAGGGCLCHRRDHAGDGRADLGAPGAEIAPRRAGCVRVGLCRRRLWRPAAASAELGLPAKTVFAEPADRNGAPAIALTG